MYNDNNPYEEYMRNSLGYNMNPMMNMDINNTPDQWDLKAHTVFKNVLNELDQHQLELETNL